MANISFLFNDLVLNGGTLTKSFDQATNKSANLKDSGRFKIFRSADANSATMEVTLAGNPTVSDVYVFRTNMQTVGTIKTTITNDAAGYDSGDISPLISGTTEFQPDHNTIHKAFTPVTNCTVVRVVLRDATNPDGYLQSSRFMCGVPFVPSVNAEYGSGWQWNDISKQTRTMGGSLRSDNQAMYRSLDITLPLLNESEMLTLMEAARNLGKTKDFAISLFPGLGGELERDHIAQVKFSSLPKVTAYSYGQYKATMSVEEA